MWECQTCTLFNEEGARQCAACDADRGSTVFDGPSDLFAGFGETTPWACSSCTYRNAGGYVCGMCYTSKSPVANDEAELSHCFETDQFPGAVGEERCAYEQRQGRGIDSEPTAWQAACPSWQSQGEDEEDYDQRSNVQGRELRIVIIGHTGAGKSATANTILGGNFFRSQASAVGITTVTERKHAQRFGRDIHVVDTPGLFDPSMTNDKVVKEITKFIGMTAPGPHAFILVVKIGRFTEEEQKTVAEFKKYFGQQMMDYLIVLFTRVEELEDQSLDQYVVKVPPELADLLRESSRRYIGFNNKTAPDKDRQARDLLRMIDNMVATNGGSRYTNEMFQEAEKAMKRQEMALRRELEGKKRKEREEIERKFKKKMEETKNEYDANVMQMQQRIKELESSQRRGNQGQSSVATEVVELRAQLMQMEREKRQEEERRMRESCKRVEELERRYQVLGDNAREKARKDVEEEGSGFGLVCTGIKNIGKGLWQGFKGLFS